MIQDVQFQFSMSINSCYGTNASSISCTLVAPQSNDYPVGEVLSSQFNPCEILCRLIWMYHLLSDSWLFSSGVKYSNAIVSKGVPCGLPLVHLGRVPVP